MIDFIIKLGEFVVGCLVLGFLAFVVVAILIEIYDQIKERGKEKEQIQERLRSIREEDS